jgi:hypothetical protein
MHSKRKENDIAATSNKQLSALVLPAQKLRLKFWLKDYLLLMMLTACNG